MTRLCALRGIDPSRAWNLLLLLAFIPGAASWALIVLVYHEGLGSHANNYTAAAAAWLAGGNPWTVGPPTAVFAGPPPMLVPFVPFIPLSADVTRLAWFGLDVVLAIWVFRRLGLGPHWIAFPPMFAAIILGHIEVVVLALIVLRGPLSGLAAVIKPYAVLPLIADRNWRALVVGAVVLIGTAPFLPWLRFLQESPMISATLARQDVGDSTFGDPLLMAIGVIALAALGLRRALWLAVPVLWPYAQPIYKLVSIPALCPILAIAWALPFPGATLVGVVVLAVLVRLDRVRPLPTWLRPGIGDVATWPRASVERSPAAAATASAPA